MSHGPDWKQARAAVRAAITLAGVMLVLRGTHEHVLVPR